MRHHSLQLLMSQAKRVWCRNHQQHPMTDVRLKVLHDVVIAAVPLQDPNYQRVPGGQTVHPEGAILVELAVRPAGGHMVLHKYGPVDDFESMSDKDPVVLAQQGEDLGVKQIAAYKDLATRYSRYLYKECPHLDPMATVWATEMLAEIEHQLSVVQPNTLVVGRLPHFLSHRLTPRDHTNLL